MKSDTFQSKDAGASGGLFLGRTITANSLLRSGVPCPREIASIHLECRDGLRIVCPTEGVIFRGTGTPSFRRKRVVWEKKLFQVLGRSVNYGQHVNVRPMPLNGSTLIRTAGSRLPSRLQMKWKFQGRRTRLIVDRVKLPTVNAITQL